MTKNTESLISACHELARTAKCDDYLILNDIADKIKYLEEQNKNLIIKSNALQSVIREINRVKINAI
ncbi:hypothetical protein OO184_10810 [Photorhabdus sp. APURE]|uniref:hypothetical protein n=1 Tax=Photorhabdus aballayi TaxID=2991723 RepID=UPI00223E4D42|nr:hypothetical protein [Photorhabdus aballayi]MCW7548418.1 hypothetical protein [Photorhabdus aballayi]